MRHTWTPDDDMALREAVDARLPLRDALSGHPRLAWWAAVCGRLGLADVSPDAVRSRWEHLRRTEETIDHRDEASVDILLERVARLEGFVRGQSEILRDRLAALDRVAVDVAALRREWSGE